MCVASLGLRVEGAACSVLSFVMTFMDIDARRHLLRIERKLDLLLDRQGIEIKLEEHMDAAGTALLEKVEGLNADVKAENAEIVAAGEAIVSAGTKFAELKELVEKQSTGALSDEEAAQLTTLLGETDSSLTAANTELTAHVAALGEDAAAA